MLLLLSIGNREKRKIHIMDFKQPGNHSQSAFDLFRLFTELLLVPIVQMAKFRNLLLAQ